MAGWALMTQVSEGRVRGRPWLGCIDDVKMALDISGMTACCAKDRNEWRGLVHM